MAKRTKQVQQMVDAVNHLLKINGISDIYNPDFTMMTWLLQKVDCYKGFNWFYAKEVDGNEIFRLAGKEKLENHDTFLQIL